MPSNTAFLALDVGEKRIGVAWADGRLRIAMPVLTLDANNKVIECIVALYKERECARVVVGLPRNQSGEETPQTAYVRDFATHLKDRGLPVAFQDESLTSVIAEEELRARNKPYVKGDIDKLAATYILKDYLEAGND
jgi:putative Holliday junction resolvase